MILGMVYPLYKNRGDKKMKQKQLTDAQLGMYLECIDESNCADYLIPLAFSFPKGRIDATRLANAFDVVAEHFSAFSTVIKEVNAVPMVMISEEPLPKLQILQLDDCEIQERKNALFSPFSFDGKFLWRGEVLETPTCVVLNLVLHHTIFDGSSIRVFNHALDQAYRGESLCESDTVFDAREKEENRGELEQEALLYFESYFDGVDTDCNPVPDLAVEERPCKNAASCYDFNGDSNEVVRFAKELGITENMLFLSAFAYTLAKWNNQKNAVFSSVESGRFGGNYQNSIGMFVKSFPLCVRIDEQTSSLDFMRNVKGNFFATLKHNNINFSELLKEYPGCADVHYVYQGEILSALPVGEVLPEVNVLDSYEAVANFDFMVYKVNGKHCFWLGYKENLYSKEYIDCFMDFYQKVVQEMMSGKKLCDFQLTTPKSEAFLAKTNATEQEKNLPETVNAIFDEVVKKYPDHIAVYDQGKTVTYREFDVISKKIATYLHQKGVGTNDFVPVLIPRNKFMSLTVMGILRAGAAYQPLDPSYPEERLKFLVKDSHAKVLIVDRDLLPLVGQFSGDVLYTDEIDALPDAPDFYVEAHPEDAFLLIYTSGTTGTPKGCILEQRNMVAMYHTHREKMGLSNQSRVATVASFGFDAGAMDIFATLMSGAGLYIVPDDIKLDLPEVEQFYEKHQITNGFMTTQLGRMFLEQTNCKSLRYFMFGGEKLVPFTPPEWVNCWNGYGPSETLAYVTSYLVKNNGSLQSIGTASYNTKLYIVDEKNRLLPTGCCGEICIAGHQTGRGYLNRPEKNQEVFVKNPFCDEAGYETMYKTGDIVRMLPDGNLDFIGRRDNQIKIRGFRVELTEIEQVIRDYPGIQNASVQAYDDPVSGKFLAAFVCSQETVDIDKLNAFILEQKPPYMVPAVTMQLETIPVNVNGKVDKKKLPKPERKFEDVTKPKTKTQQRIFDIVASVVGTEEFGIETDFYLIGLSSIGSIRLCSLLAEEFSVSVQIKDLKQFPNVEKLEGYLLSSVGNTPKIYEVYPDYPLTKTQEGILVECSIKPDSTFYNIPLLLQISEKIDVERLRRAIVSCVEAHPYLKMELFHDQNGNVRQKRMDDASFEVEDIPVIACESVEEIKQSVVTPFVLMNSRLFRIKIYCADTAYLLIEMHHIIADGTSIKLLLQDIERAYRGETLKKEGFSSFELALMEQEKRESSQYDEAKRYYETLLEGLDQNFLPGEDRLFTHEKDSGIFTALQNLTNVEQVQRYCEEHHLSMNGFLCSAFGFLLAKYAGTEYAIFNTVYHGRNDSRTTDTVGMLVKTMPVVCHIERENAYRIFKEVSEQIVDSMSNDIYSFAEICKEYGVKNDIIFIYQGERFSFQSFCGEPACEISLALSEVKAPIALQVAIENGKFRYIMEYQPELFTEQLMETFLAAFDKVIASLIEEEELKHISLLTEKTTEQLDAYNETEYEYDTSKTIVDYVREQLALYPEKDCIVAQNKTFTYGQVGDLASRIGSYLRSRGIGVGDVVSILIYRDENMIPAAHGVLMSGAAYLGLDPTYPPERLEFMMQDSGAKIAIVERDLIDLIPNFEGEVIYTDEIDSLPPVTDDFEASLSEIMPDHHALVVYSSGTTGVPKGGVLCHKNIVCFMQNYCLDMEISEKSHVANYASFGFDGGAMDVLSTPMVGATLFVVPDEIRLDMEKLEHFFIHHSITNGFVTTQVGAMFVANTKCKTLRHFIVGGEKFIPAVVPEWVTYHNGYGPSETMCYVNQFQQIDLGNLQPIGKVNRNCKEYIIDRYGNRLPFGACGELCIASGQTGCGYLNRPEKTAEVFVKNPFCEIPPYDIIYKTGDIVRQMPDGNYVFVGRRDGQVKIRGFRVELSEVEQQIRKFEGVKAVAVQAFDSNSGGKFLAAYVVSDSEIDVAKLNEFIASEKPDYMVPAFTMQIEEIPLTANSKVDKKKLPKPTMNANKKGAEPANETEEAICDIYEEVLGLEKVYADDDFFAIGGSSISAIQVVVKCNQLGYDIVFKNLFANTTPHRLSDYIQNGQKDVIIAPGEMEKTEDEDSALEANVLENIRQISFESIGDVMLTGVTGFLGSHILKSLLDTTPAKAICLVRRKADMDAETRFEMMMTYYFEDWYTDALKQRVTIVEGELGDEAVMEELENYSFATIINSAANVKHFAAGDELLKDNYSVVRNLIDLAHKHNAKLVQISSTSVSGEAANTDIPEDYLFRENQLNIGQSLENKYIYSKYQAERLVIDAISRGIIKGKIIRLGNLMARIDDSEFQINANSNGFLRMFLGYYQLGMFPIDMMDKEIEFSPIDATAKAVLLLSGTPDQFTVFHAKNCNHIHYGYLVNAMIKEGIDIQIVEQEVFQERYERALREEQDLTAFASFVAYTDHSGKEGEKEIVHQIESDCLFTTKALYRLGFAWPLVNKDYLQKMIRILIDLGLFA